MKVLLKTKAAFVIIFTAAILSGVAIFISNHVIVNILNSFYAEKATELARTVRLIIDASSVKKIKSDVLAIYRASEKKVTSDDWGSPEFKAYTEQFSSVTRSNVFRALRTTLHYFQTSNNVSSVYLIHLDATAKTVVYLVDASDDPCPPGCIDRLDINKQSLQLLENPDIGFQTYQTNTPEYGWLITAGVPVYSNGSIICYAMVDISMKEIRAKQRYFSLLLSAILLLLTVVIAITAINIVNKTIASPINKLSAAAAQFCAEPTVIEHHGFLDLNIHTGDEIEDLVDSMKQMEQDVNLHIKAILQTTQELRSTKLRADRMSELAQKDTLTGVHNKTAYDGEMRRLRKTLMLGNSPFGIVMIDMNNLKHINDTYGHEKGDEALKTLCHHICTVYKHSPVFRIGGDEFVVLLEHNDYRSAAILETSLKKQLNALAEDESLEPWEKVTASIGIALYNETTDKSPEDVFRRADSLMYEQKKKSKAKS
ncbi:MAG: GGDEF domain-containing protein [Treponema sp.]|nr:GGDEF domain-containing protein [Treponema sp.]